MRWYTTDFETLSWHGVHVHGFRIVEGERGTAELVLDIDFILEWLDDGNADGQGGTRFRLAQAILQFHEIFGLRFALDYVACSAGMTAFSISGIEREVIDEGGDPSAYRWRIGIDWPEGSLEFEAPGFSQWLVGDVFEQKGPSLLPAQRL